MPRKSPAPPPEPEVTGWQKFGRWLDDNWISALLIGMAGGASYSRLLALVEKHGGGHGIAAHLIAGLPDLMAFYFQREIQKDKKERRVRRNSWMPSSATIGLMVCFGISIAANASGEKRTFWSLLVADGAPLAAAVVIYRRDARAARAAAERARNTGTPDPAEARNTGTGNTGTARNTAGNTGTGAPGNTPRNTSPAPAPIPVAPASRPAVTAPPAAKPAPARAEAALNPADFPDVQIPTIAKSREELHRLEVDAVTRIAIGYTQRTGRALTHRALQKHTGRSNDWVADVLREAKAALRKFDGTAAKNDGPKTEKEATGS